MLATEAFGQVQKSRISKKLAKSPMAENHFFRREMFFHRWTGWLEVRKRNSLSSQAPENRWRYHGLDMVLPNGMLSFKILDRHFNSPKYICLLSETIVLICKLNYGNNFWFQQDNSPILTAKIVKEWMANKCFPVIECPARSPDLNNMENIYTFVSFVYIDDLKIGIQNSIFLLNSTKTPTIMHLYDTFRKLLVSVIENHGSQINI